MSEDKSCEQCGGLGHLKCYIQSYENKTIGFTSVDCMYCNNVDIRILSGSVKVGDKE